MTVQVITTRLFAYAFTIIIFAGEPFSVTITFTNVRSPEAGPSKPSPFTQKRGAHSISSAPLVWPPTSAKTLIMPEPQDDVEESFSEGAFFDEVNRDLFKDVKFFLHQSVKKNFARRKLTRDIKVSPWNSPV